MLDLVEDLKSFFEKPPKHMLKVGDLVTCTCHGGIAVLVELYDNPGAKEHLQMNMARIWWLKPVYPEQERSYLHTIGRLNKYELSKSE